MSAKTKVRKHQDVSPNHFFKKMVADGAEFEEPAMKMSAPASPAPISSKAEVSSESQREEEEQAIIDEAAAEAAEFETNSQSTGETSLGSAEKSMSFMKKGGLKSTNKKNFEDKVEPSFDDSQIRHFTSADSLEYAFDDAKKKEEKPKEAPKKEEKPKEAPKKDEKKAEAPKPAPPKEGDKK